MLINEMSVKDYRPILNKRVTMLLYTTTNILQLSKIVMLINKIKRFTK